MGRTKQTKKASLAAGEAGTPNPEDPAARTAAAAGDAAPANPELTTVDAAGPSEATPNDGGAGLPAAQAEIKPLDTATAAVTRPDDGQVAEGAPEITGNAEMKLDTPPVEGGASAGGDPTPAGDVEMAEAALNERTTAAEEGFPGEGAPAAGGADGQGEQDPLAAQLTAAGAEFPPSDFPQGVEALFPMRTNSGSTPGASKKGRGKRKAANSDDGTPGLDFDGSEKKKPVYFEWAKKIWETEDTFKLPDGTHWPYVIEGAQGEEHGAVICKLCQRHNKTNNFAGEGYKKGKRSALVDHQTKNREHKLLVEAMETSLKRVVLLAGVPQRLLGKVAIVTGAAKGIGLACAACLGNEGAKVVVADIDDVAASRAVQQLQLEGVVAAAAKCDVTQKQEVEQLVAWTVETYGSLDIMVANAGVVKGADFLDFSEEDWDDVLNVNLKGPFICGQVAARQMVAQNESGLSHGGAIINMSSVNAEMAIPTLCSYNASKGGLNNLTRCMAVSLAPHNIRVNAIGPGSIMTEVLQAVANNKKDMEKVLSRTPLGRVGDPYEIGQICTFLASDASSYITGQVIYADGGRMALNYTVPTKET